MRSRQGDVAPAADRVCGELGAVVHPDIRQSTPGFRDQFLQHHAGVVGDLLVGSRHEAGRVVSLSAYDSQARAAALDALVPFVPRADPLA